MTSFVKTYFHMAVAKELVVEQLKKSGLKLSNKLINSLADKYAPKIEDEDGIEMYIEDRKETLEEMANEGDYRAQQATNKATKTAEPAKVDEPVKADESGKEKVPDWAQSMMDEIKAMKGERVAETTADQFRKDPRLTGVAPTFLNRYAPKDAEGYEAAVEAAAADWKEVAQHLGSNAGTGSGTPGMPPQPTTTGQVRPASKEDVKAVMAQL